MRLALALMALGFGACKKDAVETPETRCEGGDAAACAAIAESFFYGRDGRALDRARSLEYSKRACDGGAAQGCTLLGLHHQDGLGTAWDPAAAIAAYTRGCAAGNGTSCYNLGSMYSGGHGVVADARRAEALIAEAQVKWKAACDGSEPRWCTNAAFGLGKDQAAERLRLNQRACDHGVLVGCTGVARGRRETGAIDAAAELAELEALCQRDEPSACSFAAAIRIAGPAELRDEVKGVAAANRGCDLGDGDACMVGAEHSAGKPAEIGFLERGCDRALGAACSMLARVRFQGGDAAGVRDAATRACQMGEAEDCAGLSDMLARGYGGRADPREAIRWATEACRMGHFPSCQMLVAQEAADIPVPPPMRRALHDRTCPALPGNKVCAALLGGTP